MTTPSRLPCIPLSADLAIRLSDESGPEELTTLPWQTLEEAIDETIWRDLLDGHQELLPSGRGSAIDPDAGESIIVDEPLRLGSRNEILARLTVCITPSVPHRSSSEPDPRIVAVYCAMSQLLEAGLLRELSVTSSIWEGVGLSVVDSGGCPNCSWWFLILPLRTPHMSAVN